MEWKSALTADEAALFATGLECYESVESARRDCEAREEHPADCFYSPEEIERGAIEEYEANRPIIESQIRAAEEIYEALINEIVLIDANCPPSESSCIVIAIRVAASSEGGCLIPKECTMTKLSLAKWFWQHDHDVARKFWPSINEELVCPPQSKQVKSAASSEPATKSKNSYLKTIAALSDALIDGLTGRPNTDAEAVLASLSGKGVAAPITPKTLANYLKEASEL